MLKKYVLMLCLCAALFGRDWPIYRIGIHENVPYLEKGRNELLDVYYPADAKPEELVDAALTEMVYEKVESKPRSADEKVQMSML